VGNVSIGVGRLITGANDMSTQVTCKARSALEQEIANWDREDVDLGDAVHKHFEELASQMHDWIDVAAEGRRLWDVAFKEPVEEFSPIDDMLNGVAAAAWDVAVSRIASQLNISAKNLRNTLINENKKVHGR